MSWQERLEELGFAVGMRVVLNAKDPHGVISVGEEGTVCHYKSYDLDCNIGVEWDKEDWRNHACLGRCRDNHGRYVPHYCISPVDFDLGDIDCTEVEIEDLISLI